MALRLNGQTSGYVELDVPAAAGSHTLTLPNSGGFSGQYLQTNGSGTLSWQTVAPAAFESYAIICDSKANYADGGTFTLGDWRTRDLNTEVDDPDGIVTIASNQFTLGAGSYLIRWSAPAYYVQTHQSRLYDVTNATALQVGSSEYCQGSFNVTNRSFGADRVSITANTTYEIQHRCSATAATFGFGVGSAGGANWGNSIFTVVEIFREA